MDSELSSPGPRTFQGMMRTPCDIKLTGFFIKEKFNYRLYILTQFHVITESQSEAVRMHGDYLDLISDGFVNINWKSQESERVQLGISQWHIQNFPSRGGGGQHQRGHQLIIFRKFFPKNCMTLKKWT